MTVQEWMSATDPMPMLKYLRGRITDRKLCLFNCACCRRIWQFLTDCRSRAAVEAAEQHFECEGALDENVLEDARKATLPRRRPRHDRMTRWLAASAAYSTVKIPASEEERSRIERYTPEVAAYYAAATVACVADKERPGGGLAYHLAKSAEKAAQADLLRDVTGNLYRRVSLRPAILQWNTNVVVKLAQDIYRECAFERLPVLADCLEEAGCDNADILSHCRGPGPHVRGCWVVDLILGRS